MDKSSTDPVPPEQQRHAWNVWNSSTREVALNLTSRRQATEIERWCMAAGLREAQILEAGCGTGWMCERLVRFGRVTGIDIADEVISRARERAPQVNFLAGDLTSTALPRGHYDLAVTLEVLPHMLDQPAFIAQLASVLKPNGVLIVATQNKPVLERWSAIGPPIPGTIRRWTDAAGLRALLVPHFEVETLTSLEPVGDQGTLRLANSVKLNRIANALFGEQRVKLWKERALLGHTLFAVARKRAR